MDLYLSVVAEVFERIGVGGTHDDDAKHFGADVRGRIRSAEGKDFYGSLVKPLFDPEHQNHGHVLRQASPMQKIFAAAGLL